MEDTGVTDGSSRGVETGAVVPAVPDEGVTVADVLPVPDEGVTAVETGVPAVSIFSPAPTLLQPASRRSVEVSIRTCFFIFKPILYSK